MPIVMSLSNFLHANESLANYYDLKPTTSNDSNYIDVHAKTGVVLRYVNRFQVNILFEETPMPVLKDIKINNRILPVLYFEHVRIIVANKSHN